MNYDYENLQERGLQLCQIGMYLTNLKDLKLFTDMELHRNIAILLTLLVVDLNAAMNVSAKTNNKIDAISFKESYDNTYYSKKEIVELYHPVITNYSISQAVHKNEIKYIKRGNKFFFKKADIIYWIKNLEKNDNKNLSSKVYV